MPATSDHQTLEIPAVTPPPSYPPPVVTGRGRGRGLEVGLALALLVALVLAGWQALAARDARGEVAAMDDRLAALERDVAQLRAENEALRAENEELRAEDGPLGGLLDGLLRGEGDRGLLDGLLPFLEDELGQQLDRFGEELDRGLRDFFGP